MLFVGAGQAKVSFEVAEAMQKLTHAIGRITLQNEAREPVQYAYCDVWRFEGGKMAELQAFVVEVGVVRRAGARRSSIPEPKKAS